MHNKYHTVNISSTTFWRLYTLWLVSKGLSRGFRNPEHTGHPETMMKHLKTTVDLKTKNIHVSGQKKSYNSQTWICCSHFGDTGPLTFPYSQPAVSLAEPIITLPRCMSSSLCRPMTRNFPSKQDMVTLRSPAKSYTFRWAPHVKSHDQLKGAVRE